MDSYRKPAAAGLFYPARRDLLIDEINTLLSLGRTDKKIERIFGIIAPHAGYIYSGRTAAYAYNFLREQKIETVIIISPSHREYFRGSCIYEGEGYLSPLGTIEINKQMSDSLIRNGNSIFYGINGHQKEHAVEVHIPFLQQILKQFRIVPIVMGDQDKRYVDDLAGAIADSIDDKTIILASSDLSHFYNRKRADELDSVVEQYVASLDYKNLMDGLETHKCEACGGGPIAVLLKAAELKNYHKSLVLQRSDSGDVSGDTNEVVGYLSAVVYGE